MTNAEQILFLLDSELTSSVDLLLSKLMRDDPIDRADAQFIVEAAHLSLLDITQAIAAARVPEIPEIQEQFKLASRKLLDTFAG